MTDKEVMQMALDWFHWFQHGTNPNGAHVLEVEEALRACLAQPEQYDQTELELCKKCGWKAVWPDGCLVCEKQEASVPHELEPVAWMHIHGNHEDPCFCEITEDEISQGWTQKPLYYTAPPQREWVGLTYKERCELWNIASKFSPVAVIMHDYAREIESALREKNA